MQMMAKRKGTVELGVDVLAHLLKLCVRTQKNKANIFFVYSNLKVPLKAAVTASVLVSFRVFPSELLSL